MGHLPHSYSRVAAEPCTVHRQVDTPCHVCHTLFGGMVGGFPAESLPCHAANMATARVHGWVGGIGAALLYGRSAQWRLARLPRQCHGSHAGSAHRLVDFQAFLENRLMTSGQGFHIVSPLFSQAICEKMSITNTLLSIGNGQLSIISYLCTLKG